MAAPLISVVIPCYNEETNITELYKRLGKVLSGISENYEIVMVNDGSRDATWLELSRLSEKDSRVVAIDLSRNFGHAIALTAALWASKGERVLVIDADLQDPPELLPQMMAEMDKGADIVYGRREKREGEGLFKILTAKIFYRLLKFLTDISIPVDTGDFRLMRRNVVDAFLKMPEAHRFIRGMVVWSGFKQVAVTYERQKRFSGVTNYTFRKMVHLAIDGISGFSVKPLRITFYMGLFAAFVGVLLLVYILDSWLEGKSVQGWTSLALLLVILQSAQFIFLGILGEYLGRIFTEVKRRPLFFIKEAKNADLEGKEEIR